MGRQARHLGWHCDSLRRTTCRPFSSRGEAHPPRSPLGSPDRCQTYN